MTMLQRFGAAACCCGGADAGRRGRAHPQFVSDVQVERNGDLESPRPFACRPKGKTIKRGILRDFPTSYTAPGRPRVEVGFEVQFGDARRRAGDLMPPSSCRTACASASAAPTACCRPARTPTSSAIAPRGRSASSTNFDELYWNATGTGWTFPIDVAEARITLPENVTFMQTAFYTGPQGAKRQGRDHRRAAARARSCSAPPERLPAAAAA